MKYQYEEKIKTCWYCGCKGKRSKSFTEKYIDSRYFHDDCFEEYKREKEDTLENYVQLKIKVMHERALRILEKQKANLELYYDESQAVLEKALEEPNKFLSSHEMIAAMELLKNRIAFKKEYRIGKHKVDFLIPSMKVILEIDGKTHDYKRVKDTKRDNDILNVLNEKEKGWEVIRIPTKHIEDNVSKLKQAIIEIKKHKQNLRKENHGFIPSRFSKRDKNYYESLK